MPSCRQCKERGLDCSLDEVARESTLPTLPEPHIPSQEELADIVDDSLVQMALGFKRSVESRVMERGRGKRFPHDLQMQAVSYYHKRLANGAYLSVVASELGLPPPTLRRWVLDNPMHPATPQTPKTVAPANGAATSHDASSTSWKMITGPTPNGLASPSHPVLVGPNGMRIEGLDMMSLAVLLKHIQP